MTEQIVNSAQSTLNGTINNVVTSLTVTNGAVFPASGNFRLMVCDPVTFANAELMLGTARAGNVITVTRGIETTTAVAHSTGSLVVHVETIAGLTQYISEHSVAQTIIDAKGDLVVGTAADTMVRKAVGPNAAVLLADSTQSDGLIWAGAYTAYTPVWTSTGTAPALGNGTLTGRFIQMGKTVFGRILLTAGSSTTFGTGLWFFSVPVNAHATYDLIVGHYGIATAYDTSASGIYQGFFRANSATVASIDSTAVPITNFGNTVPFAWATGDRLGIQFTYEAA
jgi:hypothetical protein